MVVTSKLMSIGIIVLSLAVEFSSIVLVFIAKWMYLHSPNLFCQYF